MMHVKAQCASSRHIAARVIFFAFAIGLIPSCSCTWLSFKPPRALITFIIGEVTINNPSRPVRKAVIKESVDVNDTLSTGKDSEIVIQIGETILVNVLENTVVSIRSLMDAKGTELHLDRGKVLNKLLARKNRGAYRVSTRTITASVRGTTFLVTQSDTTAVVAVGSGDVIVKQYTTDQTIDITADNTVVISDTTIKRPLSDLENLYIKKITNRPIIPAPEKKTIEDIKTIQENAKTSMQTIDKRIGEYYPLSLKKISENYDRIDEVKLYTGKVHHGIIVSRGDKYLIMATPEGRIQIPVNQVKYTGIKK